MSAYNDLLNELLPGEEVESIVFGAWGWGYIGAETANPELGYGEPDPPPVPFGVRGRVLPFSEARPYLEGWSFFGGFGAPECYAVYIWTNRRVGWVTQYDGATSLDWAPRHPVSCLPDMPGG